MKEVAELLPGGKDMAVSDENKEEYLQVINDQKDDKKRRKLVPAKRVDRYMVHVFWHGSTLSCFRSIRSRSVRTPQKRSGLAIHVHFGYFVRCWEVCLFIVGVQYANDTRTALVVSP